MSCHPKYYVPIAVAILGFAAIMSSVNAAPIVQSQSFTLSSTFIIPPGLEEAVYTFDQFDDMGGTRVLNSVSVRLINTSFTETVTTTNASDSAADVSFAISGTARAYVPTAIIPLASSANPADLTVTPIAGTDTELNVPAGTTVDLGPLSGTFDGAIFLTDPADLAVYTGSETVQLLMRSSLAGEVTSSVDFNPSVSPLDFGTGDFQLVYEWAEIPEPTTASLLALGTLGLLVRCRHQIR